MEKAEQEPLSPPRAPDPAGSLPSTAGSAKPGTNPDIQGWVRNTQEENLIENRNGCSPKGSGNKGWVLTTVAPTAMPH